MLAAWNHKFVKKKYVFFSLDITYVHVLLSKVFFTRMLWVSRKSQKGN